MRPGAVLRLAQGDVRTIDLDGPDEEPAVDDVARIEGEAHRSGGEEERVVEVADLDRIDPEVGDEAPADGAEPHRAGDGAGELGLRHATNPVAAALALRRGDEHADDARAEHDHHDRADEDDESAASHGQKAWPMAIDGVRRRSHPPPGERGMYDPGQAPAAWASSRRVPLAVVTISPVAGSVLPGLTQ